jgi:cytochrome P450 family 13
MLKLLHSDEVVSNVFLFMIAGYETTSTALAYSTYVLATQPHIQQRLREEIDQHQWNHHDCETTYETAASLTYLDMFVREVLRMYPITSTALTRECNTTTTVCGHTIEKGRFSTEKTCSCV